MKISASLPFFIRTNQLRTVLTRLASVGILGKEREPGVGKLGWHRNFDTAFERNVNELF